MIDSLHTPLDAIDILRSSSCKRGIMERSNGSLDRFAESRAFPHLTLCVVCYSECERVRLEAPAVVCSLLTRVWGNGVC